MKYRPLGELRLRRVLESIWAKEVEFSFPDRPRADWEPYLSWLCPDALDPEAWTLRMPMQSYIVQTPEHNILIDSCVGSHKSIPRVPEWSGVDHGRYVEELTRHGLSFEDIDYVFCTHLHADHIGWNTRLADGRWVPTFPNAKYVLSKKEHAHFAALDTESYQESIKPVVDAGQALLVDNDFVLNDHVSLESYPGHSADHVCVNIRSKDAHAVVTGDMIHSPIQCVHPEWPIAHDMDKVLGAATRRAFLERYADSDTLVCTIHFPLPSAGRIVRRDGTFRFVPDTHDW